MACADVQTAERVQHDLAMLARNSIIIRPLLIEKYDTANRSNCFALTEKKQRELITLTVAAPVFV